MFFACHRKMTGQGWLALLIVFLLALDMCLRVGISRRRSCRPGRLCSARDLDVVGPLHEARCAPASHVRINFFGFKFTGTGSVLDEIVLRRLAVIEEVAARQAWKPDILRALIPPVR